jgi:hypothetical protein
MNHWSRNYSCEGPGFRARSINPLGAVRGYRVQEDVGRIWPPPRPYVLNFLAPLRWCAALYTPAFNGLVVANAWTRRAAVRKARALWFEQARLQIGDDRRSIFVTFAPCRRALEGE